LKPGISPNKNPKEDHEEQENASLLGKALSYVSSKAKGDPNTFIRYIPNGLTFLRLALIPIFVALLVRPNSAMVIAAMVVFLFSAVYVYIVWFVSRGW
jgi:ABC-type transport system involved in multi-copper enzyme maturation permease subunit